MRNISYKTSTVLFSFSGRHYDEGDGCYPAGGWEKQSLLFNVIHARTFLWKHVLPEMAKKMEVRLGCVREYVLSLSDSNISDGGLSPAEQRVVDDALKFVSQILRFEEMVALTKRAGRTKAISFVYVNNNTLRSLVWVHRVQA